MVENRLGIPVFYNIQAKGQKGRMNMSQKEIEATGFKFHIGQIVNYTNDYGVNWGNHTITGMETAETTGYGKAYYLQPSDTPWFAVPERCLRAGV